MKLVELEMIDQPVEIAGDTCRLRALSFVGKTLAPAAPVESDGAVAGFGQCRNLRLPRLAGPGVRMQQNHRLARAAAVGKPEFDSGKIYVRAGRTILHHSTFHLLRLRWCNRA